MKYKEFKELLHTGKLVKSPDLKIIEDDTTEYYITKSGTVIRYRPSAKHIQTFVSIEEYQKLISKILMATKVKGHILEPYKEEIDNMEGYLSTAVALLSQTLQIEPERLNFSISSLQEIDKSRKRTKISQASFFDKLYFPFVAYLGEALKTTQNGTWAFKKSDKISEPHIKLPNGRTINIFLDLYKEANESYNSFSIFAIYQRLLLDLRL